MRILPWLTLASAAAALAIAGCAGEDAANKANKQAALSGRAEVALRLAHATESTGDFAAAEKQYLQVVARVPNEVQPRLELADFYHRHHEDQKAIENLNDAQKLQPNNTDISRALANTYIGMGEPERALPVLDQAIALNSRAPLLYNSRGVALDQLGDYHEAQQSYRTAFNLDPSDEMTYKINISMSYILSGAYGKAIDVLRPLLDKTDAPPIVRQNLALAYGLKGERETALKLGLQDLSESEAQENLRFYQMLSHKHGGGAATSKSQPPAQVPASVIKELFPEDEPAGTPAPVAAENPAPAASPPPPPPPPKPVAKVVKPKPQPEPEEDDNDNDSDDEQATLPKPIMAPPPLMATPNDGSLPQPVLKPDQY